MKKLMSIFLMAVMATGASVAATPNPSHIARDGKGGYKVTYDYKDKVKTGWYATVRAGVDFLNFKLKQSATDGVETFSDSEDYSFKPVFEGSLAAGHHFDYFWRGEIEAGYIGQFSDSDSGLDYTLDVPYVMANGYYDFLNGAYVGAGLGVAVPMASIDGAGPAYVISGGDRDKTGVSPMAGVMVGYATKLDDSLVLDLRYRLAGFSGVKQSISGELDGSALKATIKENFILDNSLSIGLRYEF